MFYRKLLSVFAVVVLVIVMVTVVNTPAPATAAPLQTVTTFSNPTPIDLPGSGSDGPGNPYPSSITVSGLEPGLVNVAVTLLDMSHTFAHDLNFLLVGPAGQTVHFLADACGAQNFVSMNLTFSDGAAAPLSNGGPCTSGTYQVSNYGANAFDPPAPAGPYGLSFSVFNGTDPNGTWALYFDDDAGADIGTLAGGWQLTLTTVGTSASDDYQKIGQVVVNAPGTALYEAPGGGVVRDAAGQEIWVPNPTAFDPSQDTYDVIEQTEVDGSTWVQIFVGNTLGPVWIPVGGPVSSAQ